MECPRCGQLLGVMADEAERRGETRGTCSECGLDVEWRRLRTEGVAPAWFVEARCSPRSIVRRAFGTLARTARPFRFWASLDLALPISVRGLVAFIALLCLPLLGRSASLALAAFLAPRGGDARWLRNGMGIAECRPLFPSGFMASAVLGMLVAALTPLVMFLLPVSLRRARVRPRHFVRMLALGLVMPLAVLVITLTATQSLQSLGLVFPQDPNYHLHLLGEFRDPYYPFVVLCFSGLLGTIWAVAAASRYLRLPNARAVGMCCGAISTLSAAVALVLF